MTFFAAAKASSSFPPPELPEIAFAGGLFKLIDLFLIRSVILRMFDDEFNSM